MITIDMNNSHLLDDYKQTSELQLLHKFEPEPGVFIAESPQVILRALEAGYEPMSFLIDDTLLKHQLTTDIIDKFPDVPVYYAKREYLTDIIGFKLIRGMLCEMRRRDLPSLEEVCKGCKRIAVLEDVSNPTNVGAIVRSAAALGVDAIVFSYGCADPLYRRAIRVSVGNVFQVPWTIVGKYYWPESAFQKLRDMGFQFAAMALKEDTLSIADPVLNQIDKLAIVLGSEGYGLKDTTIDMCDYTVKIPMSHGVDSLNVAAASAVAFWQLCGGNIDE